MDFRQFYRKISFDIDNEIRTSYQATQGDTKSRGLLVDLIVGGVKTPVTTEAMRFFALKPDGTRVMAAAAKDGDKFRIDFANQTFSVAGTLLCALVLYGTNGEKIADKKFKMTVDESLENGAIISKDERGILDRAFELAEEVVPGLTSIESRFQTLITSQQQDAEVIDARQGALSLGANITEVKSQLAENAKQVSYDMNREILGRKNRKPMISFVDDDCRSQIMTKWKPILIEKKVPVNFAVITNNIGTSGYATWEELKELQSLGAKFASHSHTHPTLTTLTESQINDECRISKGLLQQHGLDNDYLVYPYGTNDARVRKLTRKYYQGAIDIQSEVLNKPPLETYRMVRWTLQSNTLENYKAKIDQVISENAWLIFISHSQYEDFNETQLQYVREIIEYARSKSVEIVSLKDGFNAIGNIIDVGDYTDRAAGSEYTILDADGIWHSKSNNIYVRLSSDNPTPTTPISAFEVNKCTHNIIQTAQAVGFPEDKGGTLQTFRYGSDSYSYQIYSIFNSNSQYKRTWENGGTWRAWDKVMTQGEFDKQSKYITEPMNSRPSTDLIATYPVNKTVVFTVDWEGSAGYPATAGIVETHKGQYANWNRQIFKQYQGNAVWSRYADATGAWTPFVKISAV